MSREKQRFDRVAQSLSRRRLIGGAATLLTAGGTLVVVGDPAAAQVTVDDFAVSDAELTSEAATPVVDVTAAFEYDAGTQPVRALRFALSVGGSVIASDELVTDSTMNDGTTTLSGRVTDADAWTTDDFAPEVASSVSRELTIGLKFEVLDGEDSVIVSDTATDAATVVVSHPQESQYVAEVGGRGSIRTASE